MPGKTKGSARVILTVEVPLHGSWGSDCTLSQVHKQAKDEALGYIRQLVKSATQKPAGLRVVGQPDITAVLIDEVE